MTCTPLKSAPGTAATTPPPPRCIEKLVDNRVFCIQCVSGLEGVSMQCE